MNIEGFNIQFADNGVILEFSGRDKDREWCSRKEVFPTWVVALERAQQIYEARYDGSIFYPSDKD